MLFHSTIRKELARSFGATLIVLVTIVMTMMLIRTLGQAASGSVNPSEVGLFLGYTMVGGLHIVLTMSLFIAIVSTLSRMYLDSEMVIWQASGVGLVKFLKPLFSFSWPIFVFTTVLVLVLWPWSNQQMQELRNRFEARGDLERVSPGEFQESSNGLRVFFVEKNGSQQEDARNVFIAATDHDKKAMTSAQLGRINIINDERFLILSHGQRVEKTNGETDVKISQFETYGTKISNNAKINGDRHPTTIGSWELFNTPTQRNLGELAWRLGMSWAAVNLFILALTITSANPRVGRGGNLALALFIFVAYFNMINIGQGWISNGKVSFWNLIIFMHGGMTCLAIALLAARHNNWSWRRLIAMRQAAA
jgi:lipopolysaccharide export system permease protein